MEIEKILINDFIFGLSLLGRRPDLEGERLPSGGRRPPGGRTFGEESTSPGSQNSK